MRAARYTSYNQQNAMLDWSDKTILVAEDVPTNYMLIEAILSKTGVKLIWARDGQEAVDKCLENDHIDLILMDIQMPVMNGLEAAIAIKKVKNHIPILAQTAFTYNYEEETIRAAGISKVLNKPISPEVLMFSIQEFLRQ
jgi:two-component system cell cycle response regulator DivK